MVSINPKVLIAIVYFLVSAAITATISQNPEFMEIAQEYVKFVEEQGV